MEKSFFYQMDNPNTSVTVFLNKENKPYHYLMKIGPFGIYAYGIESDGFLHIQYPIEHTEVAGIPIEIHNTNELKSLLLALSEITNYANEMTSSQTNTRHITAQQPFEPTNIEELLVYCQTRGALVYKDDENLILTGHNEEDYLAESPFVRLTQDMDGWIRLHQCQAEDLVEYDLYVFPNAPTFRFYNQHIRIGNVKLDIAYAVLNKNNFHLHFPVKAHDSKKNTSEELSIYKELTDFIASSFQKSEEEATKRNLSVHAYTWLQAIGEDKLRTKLNLTPTISRKELVSANNAIDIQKFLAFAEQHHVHTRIYKQNEHEEYYLMGYTPYCLHFRYLIASKEENGFPLIYFPLRVETLHGEDKFLNTWEQLFDFIEASSEAKKTFNQQIDNYQIVSELSDEIFTYKKERQLAFADVDDLPY